MRSAGRAPRYAIEAAEEDRGRIETRRYWITGNIDWMEDRFQWDDPVRGQRLEISGFKEWLKAIPGPARRE